MKDELKDKSEIKEMAKLLAHEDKTEFWKFSKS